MGAWKHLPGALRSQPGPSRGNTDVISQSSRGRQPRHASRSCPSPPRLDVGKGGVLPHRFHPGAWAFLHGTQERCPGVGILAFPHLARHVSFESVPCCEVGMTRPAGRAQGDGPLLASHEGGRADCCCQQGCYHQTRSGSGGGERPML